MSMDQNKSYFVLQHSVFAFGILTDNSDVDISVPGIHFGIWTTFQYIYIQIQLISESNITWNGASVFTFCFNISYSN